MATAALAPVRANLCVSARVRVHVRVYVCATCVHMRPSVRLRPCMNVCGYACSRKRVRSRVSVCKHRPFACVCVCAFLSFTNASAAGPGSDSDGDDGTRSKKKKKSKKKKSKKDKKR